VRCNSYSREVSVRVFIAEHIRPKMALWGSN